MIVTFGTYRFILSPWFMGMPRRCRTNKETKKLGIWKQQT
jgi:hypothetical protein